MAQSFWRSFGMAATTVASRRRFKKSVMEWKTLVACQSSHSRMALTLTRIRIANVRLRTRWITIAKTTTCGHVAKSVLAIWARSSDILVFAQALASDRITFTWEWTILIAVACFALSWQGIAKEAMFALVTIPSSCISKTLKTFSSPELKYTVWSYQQNFVLDSDMLPMITPIVFIVSTPSPPVKIFSNIICYQESTDNFSRSFQLPSIFCLACFQS